MSEKLLFDHNESKENIEPLKDSLEKKRFPRTETTRTRSRVTNSFAVDCILHLEQPIKNEERLKQIWQSIMDEILGGKRVRLISWKSTIGKTGDQSRLLNVKTYIAGQNLVRDDLKSLLTKSKINSCLLEKDVSLRISSLYIRSSSRLSDRLNLWSSIKQRRHAPKNLNKGLQGLPYCLQRKIALHFPAHEAVRLGCLCRDWYIGIDSEEFYKILYGRDIHGYGCEEPTYKSCLLNAFQVLYKSKNLLERLWSASRMGYCKIIENVITDKSNPITINCRLGNRATILETASLREHINVIDLAFCLGADPYIGERHGDSAMHLAVCTNKVKSVGALIRNGCDPSRFPTLLTGPLYTESSDYSEPSDRLKMIEFLFSCGFRRSRSVVQVAITCALEKGRISAVDIPDWLALLQRVF